MTQEIKKPQREIIPFGTEITLSANAPSEMGKKGIIKGKIPDENNFQYIVTGEFGTTRAISEHFIETKEKK